MGKDALGWDCHEGCDCEEKGHIHHNEVGIHIREHSPSWRNIFKR